MPLTLDPVPAPSHAYTQCRPFSSPVTLPVDVLMSGFLVICASLQANVPPKRKLGEFRVSPDALLPVGKPRTKMAGKQQQQQQQQRQRQK